MGGVGREKGDTPRGGRLICNAVTCSEFASFSFSFCAGVLLPLRIAHSAPWKSEDWDLTSFFVFALLRYISLRDDALFYARSK